MYKKNMVLYNIQATLNMVNCFSKHDKLIYCLLVINMYVINLKVNNPTGKFS
jgi:hypothetical protein